MKKIITYSLAICLGLLLGAIVVRAQTRGEVNLEISKSPLTTNENLVTISTIVDPKQSGDGIRFTVLLKNNSAKTLFVKNIVDQLVIALYNKSGLDISVPNEVSLEINRHPEDRKWKYQSESVFFDKLYINGREEKNTLKKQEYFEIPAGGTCKVNLIIKNVKQVSAPQEVNNRLLKPTVSLISGSYKLKIWLPIFSNVKSKSGGFIASFLSPMIDVEYEK